MINKIIEEIYYSTGWLPKKLKAKQAVFKVKQEQALNQLLKNHQLNQNKSHKISIKSVSEVDKGGFDELWEKNKDNHHHQMSFTNQSAQTNQPVPPIRKSKLLSAAIVNNNNTSFKSSSTVKLIPNNSPVIATIKSPNSNQTLQVRSHLILHPSSESKHQTPIFIGHPSKLPISPIPYRPVNSTMNNTINYMNNNYQQYQQYQQQQLRQFQSAPQLPLRYGPSSMINPNTPSMLNNQTFPNYEPTLTRNHQMFSRKTLPPSFLNRQHQLNDINGRSSIQQQPHSSTFVSSSFEQSPLDQSYLTTNSFVPQQFTNNLNYNPDQTRINIRQRSMSAPDQVNLSNRQMYLREDQVPYFSPILDRVAVPNLGTRSRQLFRTPTNLGYRENTSLQQPSPHRFDSSSNFSYHPSNIFSNNKFRQHSPIGSNFYQPASFYDHKNYHQYPEFSQQNKTWLTHSPIGSDLHRIETINRLRLAQLAKERKKRGYPDSPFYVSSSNELAFEKLNKSDLVDYLNYREEQRLLDKKLKQQLKRNKFLYSNKLDQDDFEADAEEDDGANSGYLFHKSLNRRGLSRDKFEKLANSESIEEQALKSDNSQIVANSRASTENNLIDDNSINKNKSIEQEDSEKDQLNNDKVNSSNGLSEEVSSSGRGSSNLDNSPKLNKLSSATVVKSNSSSSGFASRTFSITGSPDKCTTPQYDQQQSSDQLMEAKKLIPTEVSEADENYEFDQLLINSPQSNELENRLNRVLYNKRNYSQPNLRKLRNLQFSAANSLSECTTPTNRVYESTENKELKMMMNSILKQRRLIVNTPTQSDENYVYNFDVDDYYDVNEIIQNRQINAAADAEIRHHLENRKRILNTNNLQDNVENYPNSPNLRRLNLKQLHQRTFDQRSFNQRRFKLIEQNSLFNKTIQVPLDRAVFSDSELYDNQLSNSTIDNNQINNESTAYQVSNLLSSKYYLRRLRCEQLKEEFRQKYSQRFKPTNLETAC